MMWKVCASALVQVIYSALMAVKVCAVVVARLTFFQNFIAFFQYF